MPRRFFLASIRVSIIATLIACVLGSPHRSLAEPPSTKQIVEVKLWVFEVSKTKLRNLGFDWGASRSRAAITDDENLNGFLEALDQNGLARKLATPMIATASGRKASLEISPHLKVEVTPTVIDGEHIDFAYHVEVATRSEAQPDKAGRRLISACSTELGVGAVELLSETTTQQRTAKGEPSHSTLLVLAQATIVKP